MRFSVVTLAAVSAFVVAACGAAATPTAIITPTASLVVGPTAAASSNMATPSSATPITVTTPPSSAPTPTAPPPPTPTLAPTQAPSATAAAVVDLCALLSAADLHSVLGGSWMEGSLGVMGGHCFWLDSSTASYDQVTTGIDERSIEEVKSATPNGVDMTVSGHAGYRVRDENSDVQTTYVWVDLGGQSLTMEITSSSAADDQISAQELAEIAIGNI